MEDKNRTSGRGKKAANLPAAVWLIILAAVAVVTYIGGVNHYKISGALGPLFGYNSHAGEIDLSSVQDTYRSLAANFDGDLDENKLIEGASRGLVEAAGDNYTLYMNSSEAKEFRDSLTGNIGGGIGAEIGLRNDKITVVRVLDNNPAKRAGLSAGDVILEINNQAVDGWTVDQAVAAIRGKEGTTVGLSVQRGSEVKKFSITRDIINNPSVELRVENGVGIIRISRFDDETGSLARKAAQELKQKNVKGVVVDLRGNGGGYLSAARDVAGIWLENQVVVQEKSGDRVVDTIKTRSGTVLAGVPTVILVNSATASASEILAGALQEYRAAKVVGEKTFGKGTVQRLVDLSGGGLLKVTVAKWYTPNGKDISNGGVTPDFNVELTQQDLSGGKDPQLDRAKSLLVQ